LHEANAPKRAVSPWHRAVADRDMVEEGVYFAIRIGRITCQSLIARRMTSNGLSFSVAPTKGRARQSAAA